jgi:hypothetical protein
VDRDAAVVAARSVGYAGWIETSQDAAGLSFIRNLPLVPRGGLHIEFEA